MTPTGNAIQELQNKVSRLETELTALKAQLSQLQNERIGKPQAVRLVDLPDDTVTVSSVSISDYSGLGRYPLE